MSKFFHDLRVINLSNKINNNIRNLILLKIYESIYFKNNILIFDL